MKIAILIPCYNEAPTIGKVVKDFKTAIPEATVYVGDNNSTDGSDAIAQEAGAVIVHESQQGKGYVVRTLFTKIDADVYVLVDGDDTYPATEVKALIQPIVDHKVDMVVGDRLSTTYFEENQRPMHNFGNKLMCRLINMLFGSKIKDVFSGYRAFSKDFVKNYPVLSEGFEIETEMTIHALDRKYAIAQVPVTYRDRPAGSTSKLNTYSDGFRVLKTMTLLFKDYKPLVFFSALSLILTIFATILVVPIFVEYWHTHLVPRFPTLIVGCFVYLTAILLEITGIILDNIAKNNRRLYEVLRLQRSSHNI